MQIYVAFCFVNINSSGTREQGFASCVVHDFDKPITTAEDVQKLIDAVTEQYKENRPQTDLRAVILLNWKELQ